MTLLEFPPQIVERMSREAKEIAVRCGEPERIIYNAIEREYNPIVSGNDALRTIARQDGILDSDELSLAFLNRHLAILNRLLFFAIGLVKAKLSDVVGKAVKPSTKQPSLNPMRLDDMRLQNSIFTIKLGRKSILLNANQLAVLTLLQKYFQEYPTSDGWATPKSVRVKIFGSDALRDSIHNCFKTQREVYRSLVEKQKRLIRLKPKWRKVKFPSTKG